MNIMSVNYIEGAGYSTRWQEEEGWYWWEDWRYALACVHVS